MQTKVDEVRGADPFQRDEDRLRCKQHGGEPGARRGSPDEVAREDSRRRPDACPTTADEGVANRQRRVLAGGDDDDHGRDEERDHSSDSGR